MEKCRSSRLYALVDYRETCIVADAVTKLRKAQLVAAPETFVAFSHLLFDFFSFTRLYHGIYTSPHRIHPSSYMCGLWSQADLARCQKQKSFCTYLPDIAVIRGDRMTKSAVLSDCGYTSLPIKLDLFNG